MADVDPDFTDILNGPYLSTVKTIGAGAEVLASVGVSNLAGREFLQVYNDGNREIYYGPTGVSKLGSTKGIPVLPTESVTFKASAGVEIYLISEVGNQDVIIQEWG